MWGVGSTVGAQAEHGQPLGLACGVLATGDERWDPRNPVEDLGGVNLDAAARECPYQYLSCLCFLQERKKNKLANVCGGILLTWLLV